MRRLQDWSLYLGALGIAILLAAFLLVAVTSTRRDVLLLLGGIGVILVAVYVITRPRDPTRQTATIRTASEGVNVLIIAIAVIGIVGAVNFVVNKQFSQRLDLTANKARTLSPQTVQVLQGLTEPVNVIGFFTAQTQQQRTDAQTLLKDYQTKTDKLNVQMVNPDDNPALAQKYTIVQSGTLVFEKGSRTEKVYTFDESTFTNSILKVTQSQQPVVYFTTGRGEYKPDDSTNQGLSVIASQLQQINYKVAPLSLATISGTLPADTRALVIAGPTQPFTAQDAKTIQDYLDKGGRALLLNDPNTDTGLQNVLKAWGVQIDKNLVLDPGLNYRGNAAVPVFLKFPSVPATKDLESFGVYFPGVSSLTEITGTNKTVTALFTTSSSACAKTDFTKIQQQTTLQCESGDPVKQYIVGYSVENTGGGSASPDQQGRLIVVGNAAFATNGWMNNQDALGNQQLMTNMINWLAGQEQLIAIPPRDPNVRALQTLSGTDLNLVAWTSVALLPLASLIIGGFLWWRRR